MAKDGRNNAREQMNETAHAAGLESTWLADMAEQNLKHGIGALDGMMRTVRRAADAFGHQASSISEQSATFLEQSMANAAELGIRLVRSKDPLQWAEAHSQFLSNQAQAVGSGSQSLGEALVNNSNEVASSGLHQVRKAPHNRAVGLHQVRKASRKRATGAHQVRKASRRRRKAA